MFGSQAGELDHITDMKMMQLQDMMMWKRKVHVFRFSSKADVKAVPNRNKTIMIIINKQKKSNSVVYC